MAQVRPEAGTARHEVLAPAEGTVLSCRDRRLLRQGDDLLTLVRQPRVLE